MRVVDLHPEDLLEKDAQGSIEPGERERLEAHLAHCIACRMERQLRADFASELDEEIPLERAIGLGIELAALVPPAAVVVPPARESKVTLRGPRRRTHRAVWLLAAAALLVAGAAAAAMGLSETGRWPHLQAALGTPAPATAPAVANHTKGHAKASADPSALATDDAPAADSLDPTIAALAPVITEAVAPAAAPAQVAQVTAAPRLHPHAVPVAATAAVIGPAELFDAASEARRHGDYARVLEIDHDLDARYPTSREAQVSRAIVGRLLLDRGNPTDALARFDAYLASGSGELGEEAMVGRATALDRLGRSAEATRAWTALVAAFPDSPYAARARARLESSNIP